jgi:hypothetical protein
MVLHARAAAAPALEELESTKRLTAAAEASILRCLQASAVLPIRP